MATATLPAVWTGRSGREYAIVVGVRPRHGGMASVRQVVGRGGPRGTSACADDHPLALKLWHEGDETSLECLQQEARVLVELSAQAGDAPCPRLYDLVGDPMVTGLVLEWCPTDLETWWRGRLAEPDATGRLLATLAEVARRVAQVHAGFRTARLELAHGDLKPSNVLLGADGRWLLSDFGSARLASPDDTVWAESRIVVATENFLAPEILFHATIDRPQAADTWSLGCALVALLRLRRMVIDGAVLPLNGTGSPRFRMERMNRLIETYGRDPQRFVDRPLDPAAFDDANTLPEADRAAVRDALRGVFGADDPSREGALSEGVLAFLDQSLAIDPGARFADARSMADALDALARQYIALATHGPRPAQPTAEPEVADRTEALQRELDAARDELAAVRAEGADTVQTVRFAPRSAQQDTARDPHGPPELSPPATSPPTWWAGGLAAVLVLQLLTLASVLALGAMLLLT
ncbi:MAG: serine/threonine protein kinase [Myxococcota bacterium]